MGSSIALTAFIAGPEPEGRGYQMLAQSGPLPAGGWQGNLPLVLLEWAKLRSPHPFCGRFAVAGGAIALRAAYRGEGSAGPIARAHGVFIGDAMLPLVLPDERRIFAAIPVPEGDDGFGSEPVVIVPASPRPAEPVWDGLGLAWRDRQLFVKDPGALEETVFAVLDSIDPPSMRGRIKGWCTTGQLAGRGDFLPVHYSNLLVTQSNEPLANERLLPATALAAGGFAGGFDGEHVGAPDTYRFWQQLSFQMESVSPGIGADMGWQLEMAGWSEADLGWRAVEILSQRQASYADIVAAIVAMGDLPGGDHSATSAQLVQLYSAAVASQDRANLPKLLTLFRNVAGNRSDIAEAVDAATLVQLDARLAQGLDAERLDRVIALLREQLASGGIDNGQAKMALLDDASVWRALAQNVRGPALPEGRRRQNLLDIAEQLDGQRAPLNRHKAFLKRRVLMAGVMQAAG